MARRWCFLVLFWIGVSSVAVGQYHLQRTAFPAAAGQVTSGTHTLWFTLGEPLAGVATSGSQGAVAGFLLSHREIQLLTPVAGTTWYVGTSQTIQWSWIGYVARVTIRFSADGGNTWTVVTSNILNTGSYQWVPSQATAQARIRVCDAQVETLCSESGNFTVSNPGPATLRITAPVTGATLTAGQSTTITWSWSGNIPSVNIFFSASGGYHWTTIATAVSNTGSYQWVVPESPTSFGRVRVQQAGAPTVVSTSGVFEVRSTTQTAINAAVWLEGPLNATAASMQTLLEQSQYLPSAQPYGQWGYSGNEQRVSWLSGIVDWVLIEVRNTSQVVVATTAGLLREDGQIIDEGGYHQVLVPSTVLPAGTYYIVVYHRNHIAAMSSTATVLQVGSSTRYDFRSAVDRAYQVFAAGQKSVGNFAVLAAGDVAADGIVNARDRVKSRQQLFQTGYVDSDVNLDGTVNASDRSLIRNNAFWVVQVP